MRISAAPSAANAAATARPRFPAAPVIRQVLPPNLTACRKLGGGSALGLHPVLRRRLAVGEGACVLEPRRHGRGGSRQNLVVVDVEQAQPALLAERQPDHAPELDELRLVEVPVHTLPEGVVRRRMPGDRLGVGERGLLALVVALRLLEIEQVPDLVLDEVAARRRLHRALIAAILALDRTRHVEAAQLLDGMVEHAVPEDVAPRIGEEPEARGNVRPDCRALRPRCAFALAAIHLASHVRVHLLEGDVTDSLLGHGISLRRLGAMMCRYYERKRTRRHAQLRRAQGMKRRVSHFTSASNPTPAATRTITATIASLCLKMREL